MAVVSQLETGKAFFFEWGEWWSDVVIIFLFRMSRIIIWDRCWFYVIATTFLYLRRRPHIRTQPLLNDVIHRTSHSQNKGGKTESLAHRKYQKYSREQWKWEQWSLTGRQITHRHIAAPMSERGGRKRHLSAKDNNHIDATRTPLLSTWQTPFAQIFISCSKFLLQPQYFHHFSGFV